MITLHCSAFDAPIVHTVNLASEENIFLSHSSDLCSKLSHYFSENLCSFVPNGYQGCLSDVNMLNSPGHLGRGARIGSDMFFAADTGDNHIKCSGHFMIAQFFVSVYFSKETHIHTLSRKIKAY